MRLKYKIKNFFLTMSRKKIIVLVALVTAIALIIGGFSYAYTYFTLTGTNDNLIEAGCLKVELTEGTGSAISLTDSIPTMDINGLKLKPYTYTLTNTCTIMAKYSTNFAVINTSNNDNLGKVKVSLRGDSYLTPTLISNLATTTLLTPDASVASSYLLDSGYLSVGESKSFELRMWIDYNVTSFSGNLSAKIIVDAIAENGPSYDSDTAGYTVFKNADKMIKTSINPNFDYISPLIETYAQTSGLFAEEESNNQLSYYFRGNVVNNYMTLAAKTWRIVKINADGSLKLILDDTIGNNNYNDTANNISNMNFTSSRIKTSLETWLANNLSDASDYILTTNYCYDKTSATDNGTTYYGSYSRNVSAHDPAFDCEEDYLVSTNIGLLTADEVAFAGGVYNTTNTSYYLYKNYGWWTMSPSSFNTSGYGISVNSSGALSNTIISDNTLAIRPVITITSDAMLTNTGAIDSKYTIIGLYSEDAETYSDTVSPTLNYVRSDINGKISLGASDGANGSGIAGYYLSTSSSTPAVNAAGWVNQSADTYITENIYSNGTYYVWVKDKSGNISTSKSVTINIEANKPELTSNMIPIYYDDTENVWRKADSSNVSSKYKWYDYSAKKWANVATVYNKGFDDYGSNDTGIRVIGGTYTSNGLTFDGTDDLAVVDSGFGVTLPATYSVTFSTTSVSTGQLLFGDVDNKIALGFTSSYFIVAMNSVNTTYTYPITNLTANVYHNITLVARSVSDTDFYLDGVKLTKNSSTSYFGWEDPSSYIGGRRYTGYSSYYFTGTMKNLMMWDDQLTTAEIASVTTNNDYKSVPKDNLKTYFDFSKPVTRDNLVNAKVGTKIPMGMINSMWVWIPRYRYQIQTLALSSAGNEQAFNIVWESRNNSTDTCDPDNLTANCTYVPSAFTFGENQLTGLWIAKFETAVENYELCSRVSSTTNCSNYTLYPVIKPNMVSWKNNTVGNFFWSIRGMELANNIYGFDQTSAETLSTLVTTTKTGEITGDTNSYDIHMIKNDEWGAVAYLSYSNYGLCTSGTCTELFMGDSYVDSSSTTPTYTGRSSGVIHTTSYNELGTYTYDGKSTATRTYAADRTLGYKASSTGNIYGIYDLSGNLHEYVMGNYSTTTALNTTTAYFTNYATVLGKYYNRYSQTSEANCIANAQGECVGHALYETYGWNTDDHGWATSTNSWFIRGGSGYWDDGNGLFAYWYAGPSSYENGGTRAVLSK